MNLDDVAIFLLNFSHATLLVPIILVGFLAINRKIFGQGLYLLILSLFVNNLLKSYFQVPLSSHLNSLAYAFPSGHMQSSTVLYGWLILNFKQSWFRFLLLLIIAGIGFSLIQQRYHDFYDVLGGIFSAASLILVFYFVVNKILPKRVPALLGIIILPMIILIKIYLENISYNFLIYKDLMILGLGSFTLTWLILNNQIHHAPSMANAFSSIICFIVMSILAYLGLRYMFKIKIFQTSVYFSVALCAAMPMSAFVGQALTSFKSFKYKRLWQRYLGQIIVKILKANNLN